MQTQQQVPADVQAYIQELTEQVLVLSARSASNATKAAVFHVQLQEAQDVIRQQQAEIARLQGKTQEPDRPQTDGA